MSKVSIGTIVDSDEILAGSWSWVDVKDHDALYRTLIQHGFIHHASMIHGNQQNALELACTFLDMDPIIV